MSLLFMGAFVFALLGIIPFTIENVNPNLEFYGYVWAFMCYFIAATFVYLYIYDRFFDK